MMSGLDLRSRAALVTRGFVVAASAILACVVVATTVACGPVVYVDQVTRRASKEIAGAKAVDADRYSPYYYTLAVEYLHKAREEAAHADYQAANRFGHKAEQAAIKAREEALVNRADPSFEPVAPGGGDEAGKGESGDGESGDGLAPLLDESSTPDGEDGEDDGDGGEVEL